MIAAGAQKTLRVMINICLTNGFDHLYMMHDIAGKCRLPLFDENGRIIKERLRKLKFYTKNHLYLILRSQLQIIVI